MRCRLRSAAARLLVTASAALTMGGCATKGDIRDLRTELHDLAMRQDSVLAEVRRETMRTQDTLRGQSTQLFDFRGTIARQLNDITQGLDRVEALVGENQRGITGMRDQLANMRRTPQSAGAATPGDSTAGDASGQPSAPTGDAQSVFNVAVTAFNNGSLATASAAFQSFLHDYPGSPLAPDAQFYIANILEQQDNKKADALAAYQKIPELYPTAKKVPDAMYHVGLLQIDLGKKKDARATLQRLINTYPAADAAKLARDKLKEIG